MTDSYMKHNSISSEEVVCRTLTMDKEHATGIATATTKDPTEMMLVSKSFFDKELKDIKRVITLMDPENTLLKDTNVISLSLTEAYFTQENNWALDKWYLENTHAYLNKQGSNKIEINPALYVQNGHYLIEIVVDHLPSGKLELQKNGEWLKTIIEPGKYYKEVTIDDLSTDLISLVSYNLNKEEMVVLSKFAFYFITPRFYDYLIDKVKSLATVDALGFVDKETYEHAIEIIGKQISEAVSNAKADLQKHAENDNPHNITPKTIGAAEAVHTHAIYFTMADLLKIKAELTSECAPRLHIHEQYMTQSAVESLVTENVQKNLNELVSVSPMIAVKGPEGLLPSRYSSLGINPPSTIFWNTRTEHDGKGSYDYDCGITATNIASLMNEAPKVFALDGNFGLISSDIDPTSTAINFRLTLQHQRAIAGYIIRTRSAKPKQWSVYSGNTVFLHRVNTDTSSDFVVNEEKDCYEMEVHFNEAPTCPSISFLIEMLDIEADSEATGDGVVGIARIDETSVADEGISEHWELKIELIFDQFTPNQFGVTPEEFTFCVPTKGTNRVITKPATTEPMILEPEIQINDLPLYIFAGRELGEGEPRFEMSYFMPEYGNQCVGKDHFINNYDQIEKVMSAGDIYEAYEHPAFGSLQLTNGISAEGYELKNIYSSKVEGWKSDEGITGVTIEHEIHSNNVTLQGYLLSWRNEEVDTIPDTWTLSFVGQDNEGREVTVVLDSVDQYYPFYSVEDDDIVYHAKCPSRMTVKKIILTMETRKPSMQISLNKLRLYMCERFYSIAQNTMYLGLNPVSQMCLGKAIRCEHGWTVEAVNYGKSCTVPLNDLNNVSPLETYEITNPFLTTDVMVSAQDYAVMDENSESGQIYITAVESDKITVASDGGGTHAITISRCW